MNNEFINERKERKRYRRGDSEILLRRTYQWLIKMILRIDYEVFRYARMKSLFDTYSYQIFPKDSVDRDENPDFIEFPYVTRIMCMKAYVAGFNNKRIKNSFLNLKNEEFWDRFWNIFDDGGDILCDFERFENNHTLRIITEWCDENNIPYYIDTSDSFLMWLMS